MTTESSQLDIHVSTAIPLGVVSFNNGLEEILSRTLAGQKSIQSYMEVLTAAERQVSDFLMQGGVVSSKRQFTSDVDQVLEFGLVQRVGIDLLTLLAQSKILDFSKKAALNSLGESNIRGKIEDISQNNHVCFLYPGFANRVRPHLNLPRNFPKDVGLYFGRFDFDNEGTITSIEPSSLYPFMNWLVTYAFNTVFQKHKDSYSFFEETGRFNLSLQNRLMTAILYDICVKNGSLDPERVVGHWEKSKK